MWSRMMGTVYTVCCNMFSVLNITCLSLSKQVMRLKIYQSYTHNLSIVFRVLNKLFFYPVLHLMSLLLCNIAYYTGAYFDIGILFKQVPLGHNKMCWWSRQTAVDIFPPLLFGSFYGLKAVRLVDLHNCVPGWHQTTACLCVTGQCCLFSVIRKVDVMGCFFFFWANSVLYCSQQVVHVFGGVSVLWKIHTCMHVDRAWRLDRLTCVFCVHLQGRIRKTGIPVSRLGPFTFPCVLSFRSTS